MSKLLAPALEVLRNSRHQADYDLFTNLDQELARNHVARAANVMEKVNLTAADRAAQAT